ncbi:hypothetical protein [Fodinicola acaciae]|uniref:COG1470 family protein n=1 Tax=Fodinicola acaciae TaxID=2681555 RepID=UPI0013D6663E|nr:hypothetical protein [Fodinicola acaciae]
MSTHATLDAPTLDIEPGATASTGVTIRNNSPIIEQYRFEVVGPAAGWSTVEPAVVNIYPDNDAEVSVTFAPPRSSRVRAGEHPYAVRVLPAENPGAATAVEGLVRVLPFFQTTAEITPRTSRGRRKARHEVAVDNTGNVPVHVDLTGGDPDGQLDVRPRPSSLTVQPGQALFSAVDLRSRHAHWRGQPITRPFQLMVTPADGQPIVLDANMLQLPILPRNIFRWIAAILALLVLLVAAWFLLAKPTLEQVANNAAQTAAAQQKAAVDQAAADAKKANQRLDRTPGAPPDAGGPASPAPSTGPGGAKKAPVTSVEFGYLSVAAVNGQQSSLTTNSAVLRPGSGQTIIVPSVTIQNPQKDSGTVEILVDGQRVWGPQALDNLFELKYEFNPTLTLSRPTTTTNPAPPQRLQLRINCVKAGDPLTVNNQKQGGGTCRESGVFSYTLITPQS